MSADGQGFRKDIPLAAWWVLALMTLDNVLAVIDRNAVSILKTTLKAQFSIDDTQYAWLVTAFMVPYAIFYVILGRVIDRWGSRGPLTVFVLIWSSATLASGLANSFSELVIWRIVLGAAEAGLLPATIYALVTWFPRDRLATVYAIKTPLQALGPILSAPVIAALAIAFGWRAAFIVPAVLGYVFAVLWWFADRNPPRYAEPEPKSERTGAGVGELLRMPVLWGVLVARLLTDPVWFFFQYWQAGYLQEKLGATLADLGWLLWIPPLVTSILTFGTAWMSDRMIRRGVAAAPARLRVMQLTAVLAPLVAIVPFAQTPGQFVVLATFIYFMAFTWLYLSNVLIAGLFPKRLVGSAIGIVNCVGTVGAAGANLAAGSVIQTYGYAPVFVALAFTFPLAAIAVQWFYRREFRNGGRPQDAAVPATGAQGAA